MHEYKDNNYNDSNYYNNDYSDSNNKNIGVDLDNTILGEDGYIKDDVYTYLPQLYNKGFILHIITARSSKHYNEVAKLIVQIQNELKLLFKTLTCTDRGKKGYYASKLQCKCMIDDDPYFLDDCGKYGVYPILLAEKIMMPEYKNFDSWKDIYDFLVK